MEGRVVDCVRRRFSLSLTLMHSSSLSHTQGGTEVRVKLARRSEQIPGVAGLPEAPPKLTMKEVRLKRERVMVRRKGEGG
jgi:hypothetical protein